MAASQSKENMSDVAALMIPDSPLTRSFQGHHTPGKTPTNQQYRRRTPGSIHSDISVDEHLSTGLTPGKHLCHSSLLENFSMSGECSGILENLHGLSMATETDTAPNLNDSGLGLSPLSPRDALTGSSPKTTSATLGPLGDLLNEANSSGNILRSDARLTPFKITSSPLHKGSSPPNLFASHNPVASRLTSQISKRKLLHEEARQDEARLLHRQHVTLTNHGYMPLTNNPGRLPLTLGSNPLTMRDHDLGDLRSKREKTLMTNPSTLSHAQAPRKAASSSKRGEYRCGRCGFFPKKTKHNCNLERARRQAAGEFVPGDKSTKKGQNRAPSRTETLGRITPTLSNPVPRSGDPMLGVYNDPDSSYSSSPSTMLM
eukprot:TRINITY_DN12520_c0_g5_i1.p1 TRINITY_DN12520_c0_g5~~TRINITY_DN12520_c0_g5_i1.p1  ORF type:complete len:373 (+),score=38.08 TRINITY_DN12520_c0_g5_i1:158-1276(+)